MQKGILILVILAMCLSLFSCKKDEICDDSFIVTIKSDYHEEFANMEFTASAFKLDNIDKVVYGKWYEDSNHGYLTVYLKKEGKRKVLNAVEHCKTLEFVENAEVIPIVTID